MVPENLLIEGNRVQVIDFDDAGFGWHLFELATSLYFITGESIYPAARDALIRGYRSERPLAEDELDWLPLFLAARGTTYFGWVHTRQGSETAREMTPFLIERACAPPRSTWARAVDSPELSAGLRGAKRIWRGHHMATIQPIAPRSAM